MFDTTPCYTANTPTKARNLKMSISQGVANKNDLTQNCVLMRRNLNQVGGGSVTAYVLYINGNPIDHSVSFDQAKGWYDHQAAKVQNPAKVLEVGSFATGQIYIREVE